MSQPLGFEEIRHRHLSRMAAEAGTPSVEQLRDDVEWFGGDFGPVNGSTSIMIEPQDYTAVDGSARKCWRVFNYSKGDGCNVREFDTLTFERISS